MFILSQLEASDFLPHPRTKATVSASVLASTKTCGHRIPATCRTSGRRASGAQRLEAAGNLQLESEPTTDASATPIDLSRTGMARMWRKRKSRRRWTGIGRLRAPRGGSDYLGGHVVGITDTGRKGSTQQDLSSEIEERGRWTTRHLPLRSGPMCIQRRGNRTQRASCSGGTRRVCAGPTLTRRSRPTPQTAPASTHQTPAAIRRSTPPCLT
mmetsp:Transcript_9339/g.22100  ORF Transcript_9339/g.22100 Transcript_9339/m.22100 type:complete len:212 (+) Transcript_9339:479-1114(+)